MEQGEDMPGSQPTMGDHKVSRVGRSRRSATALALSTTTTTAASTTAASTITSTTARTTASATSTATLRAAFAAACRSSLRRALVTTATGGAGIASAAAPGTGASTGSEGLTFTGLEDLNQGLSTVLGLADLEVFRQTGQSGVAILDALEMGHFIIRGGTPFVDLGDLAPVLLGEDVASLFIGLHIHDEEADDISGSSPRGWRGRRFRSIGGAVSAGRLLVLFRDRS